MKDLGEILGMILLAVALMFFLDPQELGKNVDAFYCGFRGDCGK